MAVSWNKRWHGAMRTMQTARAASLSMTVSAAVSAAVSTAVSVAVALAAASISTDALAQEAKAPAQAASTIGTAASQIIAGGLFGDVTLIKPEGTMRGFVVLYSGDAGWKASDQQAAETLAHHGAMVVGVDTPRYAAKLALTREGDVSCHYLVGDAEAVSHQLQREAHSSRYFLPILAGVGQGALVAERTLGRAPSNTLSGAAILDPDLKLDARFNPCAPDPTIDRGNGLTGFLATGSTQGHDVMPVITTGGKPVATHRFAAGTSEGEALLALVSPHLMSTVAKEDDVSDLPLIALPANQPSDLMAIVISGDGGWRDLDKTIAESLQKKGIPVVGIDALRYFWSERSPAQTSHDISRVIAVYGSRWHSRHIALIGYSFGADVMPFIYNRLPAEQQAQVTQLSLLGFASKADFQIRVTGWLGLPASHQALAVLPETEKVPVAKLQCFYGATEDDTACPDLVKIGATVIRTDGGHHFGGDYDDLAKAILERWHAQIAGSGAK